MAEIRSDVATQLKRHAQDSGSTEVQVALLTERINTLNKHYETHAKDYGSKRGLLILVGRRRKLLEYLKGEDLETYKKTIALLGLRK
jgi:small subunit ribosomal protein S15